MPALLVAGAFVLPLLSRTVEWFGLPRELRIVLPLVLGAVALAGLEQFRRSVGSDVDQSAAGERDPLAGRTGESHNASE